MLNPPIITPGRPVSLDLFLHTPRSILDAVAKTGRQLYLCSVSVRLRRKTHAQIGEAKHVDDTAWVLWSVKSVITIQQEKMGIVCSNIGEDSSNQLTNPRIKCDEVETRGLNLPAACEAAVQGQPDFEVCFASRIYTIEVAMGIAVFPHSFVSTKREIDKITAGPDSKVQYTRTDIRVMISDPPPDYETDARQDGREFDKRSRTA